MARLSGQRDALLGLRHAERSSEDRLARGSGDVSVQRVGHGRFTHARLRLLRPSHEPESALGGTKADALCSVVGPDVLWIGVASAALARVLRDDIHWTMLLSCSAPPRSSVPRSSWSSLRACSRCTSLGISRTGTSRLRYSRSRACSAPP